MDDYENAPSLSDIMSTTQKKMFLHDLWNKPSLLESESRYLLSQSGSTFSHSNNSSNEVWRQGISIPKKKEIMQNHMSRVHGASNMKLPSATFSRNQIKEGFPYLREDPGDERSAYLKDKDLYTAGKFYSSIHMQSTSRMPNLGNYKNLSMVSDDQLLLSNLASKGLPIQNGQRDGTLSGPNSRSQASFSGSSDSRKSLLKDLILLQILKSARVPESPRATSSKMSEHEKKKKFNKDFEDHRMDQLPLQSNVALWKEKYSALSSTTKKAGPKTGTTSVHNLRHSSPGIYRKLGSRSPIRNHSGSPIRPSSISPRRYKSKLPLSYRKASRSPNQSRSQFPIQTPSYNRSCGVYRSQSPKRSRSRSPEMYKSRSSGGCRMKSPGMYRSLSPRRHSSRSPGRYKSRSPGGYRMRSPGMYRSRSPSMYRGQSSGKFKSRSPLRYRSKSPGMFSRKSPKNHSRSPGMYRSQSPRNHSRRSPGIYRSQSPRNPRSRSPGMYRSQSPRNPRSRSPGMYRSQAPRNIRSRSPGMYESHGSRRYRSRSPIGYRSKFPEAYRSRSPPSYRNNLSAYRDMEVPTENPLDVTSPYKLIGALCLIESAIRQANTPYALKVIHLDIIKNVSTMSHAAKSAMFLEGFELKLEVVPGAHVRDWKDPLYHVLDSAYERKHDMDVYVEARAHDDEMDIRGAQAFELAEYFRGSNVVIAITPLEVWERRVQESGKKKKKKKKGNTAVPETMLMKSQDEAPLSVHNRLRSKNVRRRPREPFPLEDNRDKCKNVHSRFGERDKEWEMKEKQFPVSLQERLGARKSVLSRLGDIVDPKVQVIVLDSD